MDSINRSQLLQLSIPFMAGALLPALTQPFRAIPLSWQATIACGLEVASLFQIQAIFLKTRDSAKTNLFMLSSALGGTFLLNNSLTFKQITVFSYALTGTVMLAFVVAKTMQAASYTHVTPPVKSNSVNTAPNITFPEFFLSAYWREDSSQYEFPLEHIYGKIVDPSFNNIVKLQFLKLNQIAPVPEQESCNYYDEARLPARSSKNRHSTVLPYNFTRVKLENQDDFYINASHVIHGDRHYIATQGPLQSTQNDFWNMILAYRCGLIVNLTKPIENLRDKCFEYWAMPTKQEIAPGIFIEKMNSKTHDQSKKDELDDHTHRFRISGSHGNHIVTLINFFDWPDQCAPPLEPIHQVILASNSSAFRDAPIVVHCSAGIGRTGTFIELEKLYRQMEAYKKLKRSSDIGDLRLNIVQDVIQMRQYRMALVNSFEQLQSIYFYTNFLKSLSDQEKKLVHNDSESYN